VQRAAALGIQRYASRRLVLFTDIDPAIAASLPALIDQAYDAWVSYCGELPPNRAGSEFQITGYVIADPGPFRESGLLPEDLPFVLFGRHRGAEFWMRDQALPYYRRHLLIHEATHCFMTAMPGLHPPLWYLEGMAEYFATHVLHADGRAEFGVMPQSSAEFPGLGRIELLQQAARRGDFAGLDQIALLTPKGFSTPEPLPYAWSWGLCKFLDAHPRYQARFRDLSRHLEGNAFQQQLVDTLGVDRPLLDAEWHEFLRRVEYGFDVPRNAFVLSAPAEWDRAGVFSRNVPAGAGWQSTGLRLPPGERWELRAGGTATLGTQPRPWLSTPDGITARYVDGAPLGALLAGVLPPDAAQLQILVVGSAAELSSAQGGELFLRVNDFGRAPADRTGGYDVELQRHGDRAP
jgi:hypothetical protein